MQTVHPFPKKMRAQAHLKDQAKHDSINPNGVDVSEIKNIIEQLQLTSKQLQRAARKRPDLFTVYDVMVFDCVNIGIAQARSDISTYQARMAAKDADA